MITLALDASTYVGDVAVLDGVKVLAEESTAMKDADRERLMPAVASKASSATGRNFSKTPTKSSAKPCEIAGKTTPFPVKTLPKTKARRSSPS